MKRTKATPERLGGRERETDRHDLRAGKPATAEEIRARLKDPPGDSSVRVMLARLEKKGFVKHRQDGLRYVYSATASPDGRKTHGPATIHADFFRRLTAGDADGSHHGVAVDRRGVRRAEGGDRPRSQ